MRRTQILRIRDKSVIDRQIALDKRYSGREILRVISGHVPGAHLKQLVHDRFAAFALALRKRVDEIDAETRRRREAMATGWTVEQTNGDPP